MNSIPLIKGNTPQEINTSIIALKKALSELEAQDRLLQGTDKDVQDKIKQINELIEGINTHLGTVDTHLTTIDGQMTALQPVDTVTSGNMHSVTSGAVYESMGIIWQGTVTMASDITSVYNWCKTHHVGSRVCAFRISSAGQASSEPFGTSSVTVIYCMSSVNYGWIMGLSDKANCNSAIAYVNEGSVSPWQKLINSSDLGQQYNDSSAVDISSQVTMSLGVTSIRARRFNNMVYISFSGAYTGQPSNATQILISGLPQKYRPSFEVVDLCALGYSSNFSSVGRVVIATDGTIYLQETEWLNNTAIRAGIIYFI